MKKLESTLVMVLALALLSLPMMACGGTADTGHGHDAEPPADDADAAYGDEATPEDGGDATDEGEAGEGDAEEGEYSADDGEGEGAEEATDGDEEDSGDDEDPQ